jgi:hypothetical protein
MRRNIPAQSAQMLIEQMQKIADCNESEFEFEAQRGAALTQVAMAIAAHADTEAKLIIGTRVIPQDSIMVVGIQDIVEKEKKLNGAKGLLMDEFTRS